MKVAQGKKEEVMEELAGLRRRFECLAKIVNKQNEVLLLVRDMARKEGWDDKIVAKIDEVLLPF